MNVQRTVQTGVEDLMANAIRALPMDAAQTANSGHPGAPMGLADVATVLFNRFVKVDPSDAQWPAWAWKPASAKAGSCFSNGPTASSA